MHVDILEGEGLELVFLAGAHIEEVAAGHPDVLHHDVIALREGHVGAVLGLEKLRPRAHDEEASRATGDVAYGDIFVVLGRVGAHLQPEHAVGIVSLALAEYDVPIVERLTAQRQTTVYATIVALLDEDALAGSVLRHLVGPCALATLQHYSIVAHMHVAAAHHNILADVNIDGIRARRPMFTAGEVEHATRRRIDEAIDIAHAFTTIEVVGPEG